MNGGEEKKGLFFSLSSQFNVEAQLRLLSLYSSKIPAPLLLIGVLTFMTSICFIKRHAESEPLVEEK